MKRVFVFSLALLLSAAALRAEVHIYGLYMADVTIHEDDQRYYQDTMFVTYKPNAAFNGCVDVMVLKGWYSFGNNFEYPEVDDNVLDSGQKARYVNRGTCSGVKVKCLDPEVYPILNPVTGKEATADTPEKYINAANMRRSLLFEKAVLEEGTNYFTIVCPQANELTQCTLRCTG